MLTPADFTFPAKRGVKLLTDRIGSLGADDHITATFFSERYGVFVMTGSAALSTTVGMRAVGGQFIEQGGKPDKTLQLLELLEEPSVIAADDTADLAAAVSALSHGDLVRAQFTHRSYGDFTISGPAVWSVPGAAFLIGGWLVASGGAAAPRLVSLATIAAAGSHPVGVPASITRVGEDADL